MEIKPLEVRVLFCKRCQHQWPTRLIGRNPIMCPECRSTQWNTDEEHLPKPRKPFHGRVKAPAIVR